METKVNITMAISSLAKAIEMLTIAQLREREDERTYWKEEAIEQTKKTEKWLTGERLSEI